MFRCYRDVEIRHQTTSKEEKAFKEDIEYFCDLCGQGPWLTEADIDIHRKNTHKWDLIRALKDSKVHICSICLRIQKDRKSLIQHILVNHYCSRPNAKRINRDIFICNHCDHLFFNKQLLITHILHWHTPKTKENKSKKSNCAKCWKFIRGKSMWFHLLYHGVFAGGTCPICLKICENHNEMLEHVQTHPCIFVCNICGYETTRESYLLSHSVKHKKAVPFDTQDVSKYFLPQKMAPSISNRMTHVFKGIPFANEIKICILCRALCFTQEEMKQHIYGDHMPEETEKSKTYFCVCGEQFFNNVLLKHHVFKMKGQHKVWDGISPMMKDTSNEMLYQVFEINEPIGANEIIIAGFSDPQAPDPGNNPDHEIIRDFEDMES